jgi:hypothetical protein
MNDATRNNQQQKNWQSINSNKNQNEKTIKINAYNNRYLCGKAVRFGWGSMNVQYDATFDFIQFSSPMKINVQHPYP